MTSSDESNSFSITDYLKELKSSVSSWEDVVLKSQKFNANLKGIGQSAINVIDSVGLICSPRRGNIAGLDRVIQLLSEVTVMERCITDKVCTLNKAVQDNIVINLSKKMDTWRKSVSSIKRERNIGGRKAKNEYKKSLSEVTKLEKKIYKQSERKLSLNDTTSLQIEYASQDLQNKGSFIDELERCVLRKAICEERSRYRSLVESLRPVLDVQLSMQNDLERLKRIYDELYSCPFEDLSVIPSEVESYVKQYQVSDRSRANSFCSVYSRTNSSRSINNGSPTSSTEEYVFHAKYQPPHSNDNLDISSSTLRDTNNLSANTYDPEKDCEFSEDDADLSCTTELNVCTAQTSLYPNQAIPAPRYTNLRQLKQSADKKFGAAVLSRNNSASYDVTSHYTKYTTPQDHSSHSADDPLHRDLSRLDEENAAPPEAQTQNADSHESDYASYPVSRDIAAYCVENLASRGLPIHSGESSALGHVYCHYADMSVSGDIHSRYASHPLSHYPSQSVSRGPNSHYASNFLSRDVPFYNGENMAPPSVSLKGFSQASNDAFSHYASCPVSSDVTSHYIENAIPPKVPLHRGGDAVFKDEYFSNVNHSLPRHSNFTQPGDQVLPRNVPPFHFNDNTTITRDNSHHEDNDIYSTMSQIYGPMTQLTDITSGTSTFKRRKPSTVTAMEAPMIAYRRGCHTSSSSGQSQWSERNETKDGRSNIDFPDIRYNIDIPDLSGYPSEISNIYTGFLRDVSGDLDSIRTSCGKGGAVCREATQSLDAVLESDAKTREPGGMKQQRLHSMRYGHTSYQRPLSPVIGRSS